NNAAVAAAALRSLGRVAVIDVDYHHGNGTQDIFWHTPEVMLLSLHGDPAFEYPHYAGAASETGAGNILNLPLPAGTDEMAYLAALTAGLARVQAFDPAAVVVQRRPHRGI
nr:histone deacetylase family protein [Anaerolineae bacterium]